MISTRTFRVFVSSTFSDLKAERNALQERVFPKLKELCAQHSCRFQAIDLRWGVSEGAALDQQAMRICLEEVGRCQRLSPRPNFIILLGDRYGWQPAPYEIPTAEFEKIIHHISEDEKDILATWYRRDGNAVPPVYCLQPCEGEYEEFSAWEPVEKKLLGILRKGVAKIHLPEESRIKYFSSATEQEIYKGALNASDAKEHVFCFLRWISELPQDNTAKDYIDLDQNGYPDQDAFDRLARLKERLRNDLPGNVHEYACDWVKNISPPLRGGDEGEGENPSITTAHIDKLCEDVYSELSGIIMQEIASLQQVEPLEQEIAEHTAFAIERARNFTGRAEIRERILAYEKDNSHAPLVIYGAGGSGKSALMARVSQLIAEQNPNAIVISRFIGATPASTNIFSLLESLCRQVVHVFGQDETGIPTEYKELVEEFKKKLTLATEEKPLILMLDALDQLSDAENAKNLLWLPSELPENVKIIVATLDPSVCIAQLKRRYSGAQIIPVGPMKDQEGEALLDQWLAEAEMTLKKSQKVHILDRFKQCPLPLYMKLAFEEARHWKSYDKNAEISGADIKGVILEFLGNLSEESRHGEVMVKRALGYLAAGKNGLTEEELLSLLSADTKVMNDFKRRSPNSPRDVDRLPVVVWSRLYLDLRPYLTERTADHTTVITFFHREFGEVIRNAFLHVEMRKELHRHIAGYFKQQPYEYVSDIKKLPHYRKVSEIAYQMMQGEMWEELQETITDFDYTMTKCKAEMVDELIMDYQNANKSPVPDKQSMQLWATFFKEHVHILRRGTNEWPTYKILLQLAMEHADESQITRIAEEYLLKGKVDWTYFVRSLRPKEPQPNACVAVLDGQAFKENGVLELRDGRLLSRSRISTNIWNRDGSLGIALDNFDGAVELRDGRILLWSHDLRLFESDGTLIKKMERHHDRVNGAIVLRDGRILSWSEDNTLCLWHMDGRFIEVLKGHNNAIDGAIELSDGRILSWSRDCTLRLWDREGIPIRVLKGHLNFYRLQEAKELSDGRILSWSDDSTLRLWDREGNPISVLEGHCGSIKGAAELSDGRILSWAQDKTLRLWDKEGGLVRVLEGHLSAIGVAQGLSDVKIWSFNDKGGVTLRVIEGNNDLSEGHKSAICGATVLSDGSILSWFDDGILQLWDREGSPIRVLKGHHKSIEGAKELSDGSILSWAQDNTLRIWDKDGISIMVLNGHSSSIEGAIELGDGRILSWALDSTLRIWNRINRTFNILGGHSTSIGGALGISNGRFLSWSLDSMCIWSREGSLLVKLRGEQNYSSNIMGVIELTSRRILSWFDDGVLQLWDREGNLIRVLEGHRKSIEGAIELSDGRILSWDRDCTLRLWDREGNPIRVLKGQLSHFIEGVKELHDGRILSWYSDNTLHIWSKDGSPIRILKGHLNRIEGAIELSGGRILSWAQDKTLRIWNRNGHPLRVLKCHRKLIEGASELSDGKIMSWSRDELVIWDKSRRKFNLTLRVDSTSQHPEWTVIIEGAARTYKTSILLKNYFSYASGIFSIETFTVPRALWYGESVITPHILNPDGTILVTQANGQVCFLKLYHGNRRISLDELETIIAEQSICLNKEESRLCP